MPDGQPPSIDFGQMLQMAQDMQARLAKAKEELCRLTVSADAGGGMVTVKANCCKEILEVTIDPAVVDPQELGMLQDLIVAAVNKVLVKAEEKSKESMEGELAQFSGLIPPGMGL